MDNINLINQQLAQLRALIPQFRTHLSAAEARHANEIITLKLKRIEAINALETKLAILEHSSRYITPAA